MADLMAHCLASQLMRMMGTTVDDGTTDSRPDGALLGIAFGKDDGTPDGALLGIVLGADDER